MSDFSGIHELLNTTAGMTVLRNNSGQDDGVDSVTGVSWFTFNGTVASTIYVSGNSFVGFGSNAEHLKVCRRDGKMWYLYRQEGTVGSRKFLKIRWEGYSWYGKTASTYSLKWELFLFDDGGLFLNIIDVPDDASYLGVSELTSGSNVYAIPVSLSTAMFCSFIPNGSNVYEVVVNGYYPGTVPYNSYGFTELTTSILKNVTSFSDSKITWVEELPEGTSVTVSAKLSDGEYTVCENGASIPALRSGSDLSQDTLTLKVELETTNPLLTPTISDIIIKIYQTDDNCVIILNFDEGKLGVEPNIRNAVDDVSVQYIGSSLIGQQGPVLGFLKKFTPVGLIMKPHPNDPEHFVIVNPVYTHSLIGVEYMSASVEAEHFQIYGGSFTGTLTHIDDI